MSDTKPSTPEYRAISSLHNWENNPRTATKDGIERLIKQIKKLGVYKPLLITEDGTVLGGNMRLKALEQMGEKKVWVSVVQADTEEKKIEYALSDNDRVGKYEGDQLANLIGNFPEVEWGDYSVDIKEPELVSDLMDSFKEVEEDEAPAVEMGPAESKLGEVYQLGRHRVMCGDSTKIEDVEKLMDGKKADMVFTDPPYNVGLKYEEYQDNKSSEEYKQLISDYVGNGLAFSPTLVITPGKSNEHYYYKMFNIKDSMTWYKKFGTSRGSLYKAMVTEPILFIGEKPLNKNFATDILEFMTDRVDGLVHACPKPIKLISEIITTLTENKNTILDLFLGSGSTLIACEQTNRICYGMELDPHYVDVIRKRYDNFVHKTGLKQEKNAKQ